MSVNTGVWVTLAGDAGSVEIQADTNLPVAALLPGWAAQVSTAAAEDLVVVAEDTHALVDPDDNLAAIGVGYGAVLRLATPEAAMALLDVATLDTPALAVAATEERLDETPERSEETTRPGAQRATQVFNIGRPATAPPEPPATTPGAQSLSPLGSPAINDTRTGQNTVTADPVTAGPAKPDPAAVMYPSEPAVGPPPHTQRRFASQGEDLGGGLGDVLPPRVSRAARWSASLRAVVSAKAVAPAAPATGFAKAPTPGAGERWRLARQGADRVHSLEQVIRQATLSRCVVIAVVSPKGGAGKTSITALLASLFAELRRDPVLALDANPDFGNLADKMGAPAAHVDELAVWLADHPAATPAELSARLGRGPHGARFLPTAVGDMGRMIATADVALYSGLLARLRDYEGIILVDCGTGLLDPPVRAALDAADQVVLVTDSSADTAGLVVTAARYLREATPVFLAVNKMPAKGSMLDLVRVAEALPGLAGMTVVPEVRLAENLITPAFDWSAAPGPWVEPLRELAARLAQGWAELR